MNPTEIIEAAKGMSLGEMIILFIVGFLSTVLTLLIKSDFFIGWIKERVFNKKSEESLKRDKYLKDTISMSPVIQDIIDEMRHRYGAARVWITQVHNGGSFWDGEKSMLKTSITYESVSDYTPRIMLDFQGAPIGMYPTVMSHLHKGKIIILKDTSNLKDNEFGLNGVYIKRGDRGGVMMPLQNHRKSFIGTVGVDFHDPFTMTDKEIKELEKDSILIAGHLSAFSEKTENHEN